MPCTSWRTERPLRRARSIGRSSNGRTDPSVNSTCHDASTGASWRTCSIVMPSRSSARWLASTGTPEVPQTITASGTVSMTASYQAASKVTGGPRGRTGTGPSWPWG